MRAVVQRVSSAAVTVGGEAVGEIGVGWLVLVGVAPDDSPAQAAWLADRVAGLRAFPDDAGKMNRSVAEVGGGVLVVSNFTLYADTAKGRRPGFGGSARPEVAEPLYGRLLDEFRALGVPAAAGRFGAAMQVTLVNDGPATFVLDSPPA
jgi:D-tyrosyl-tRNA(Tyr) deacylase